ncbi:MAG: TIGR04283 family arsenosugar biosynthesis glycosyltransferase [Desulfomonilaceae bacterium]
MRNGISIAVIIPALNEEKSIGRVLTAIPKWIDEIIVVDNGSTDNTPTIAAKHGARVVFEPQRGYGSACLKGIASLGEPDIVVFMDADFSDHPEEAHLLVDPIVAGIADMVIGSRVLGNREDGALTPQAIFGNWLSCKLIALLWKTRFTDLGPFRAIRFVALQRLGMCDPDYGWTVEMQIKAARQGLRCMEVPVSYRKRIGKSKISGTVRGVFGAGAKILYTIFTAYLEGFLSKKSNKDIIIIFCRYPAPGTTKTRLIPALGAQGSADYHRLLSELIVSCARDFVKLHRRTAIEIYYTGGNEALMKDWLGADLLYVEQPSGDLGSRMQSSFDRAFLKGAGHVVIFGTDVPALSVNLLEEAFKKLKSHDMVLGPSEDGGYYLIGLNRPFNGLFQGIAWGTHTVAQDTLRLARQHHLAYDLIKRLKDVDRPEDVIIHEGYPLPTADFSEPSVIRSSLKSISVIIPTLNEESNIANTLATVMGFDNVEIIVVDGGSTDRTVEIACAHDATVLSGPGGKAAQMNLGALAARGEFLVFLHADTLLPEGWVDQVHYEMQRNGAVAGAFKLHIDCDLLGLRLIETLANLRSLWLGMPYGDQAIFTKSEIFRSIGGFPNQPIMEDFELMRRLRKRGRINIAPEVVFTSARRWKDRGIWATTATNQVLIIAYLLGISPKLLVRFYGR